jgi:hypothetical protein
VAFFTSSFRGLSTVLLLTSAAACSASSDGGGSFEGDTTGAGGSGGSSSSGNDGGSITVGTGVGGGTGGGASCTQNIDIVFVMDVSTSMGAFLNKLANEIPVVDAKVKEIAPQSIPHYGLVVFVDDVAFANAAGPYQDVFALQQEFSKWASFSANESQVSGNAANTTYPENSLDALYDAATKFAWRPAGETLRIVIHTTDDTFWDGPTNQDGVAILHGYDETVDALQQEQIRVFPFANKMGGAWEAVDVSAGWFGPHLGDPAIPVATGGTVFELDHVLQGQVSLSASINQSVIDSFCEPYPRPD